MKVWRFFFGFLFLSFVGFVVACVVYSEQLIQEFRQKTLSEWRTELADRHALLLKLMQVIHFEFENHQVNYALTAGSLLGHVRHQAIIPYDDDMDAMILLHDSSSQERMWHAFTSLMQNHNFCVKPYLSTEFCIQVSLSENFDPHIDFFLYQFDSSRKMYVSHAILQLVSPRESSFKASEVFPLQLGLLGDHHFWVPRKSKQLVERMFPGSLTKARFQCPHFFLSKSWKYWLGSVGLTFLRPLLGFPLLEYSL